ncbi:MAG TPA: helicase [Chloroflexia bacterium]|nr:helicase [Chloroflexia bacterium]
MEYENDQPAVGNSGVTPIDMGRIYEPGFNTGIISYILQEKINHKFDKLYEQQLQRFRFEQVVERLATKYDIVSSEYRLLLQKWATDYFRKGYLAGYNFFREYLEALGWDKRRVTIFYFQADFGGDNSQGLYPSQEAISLLRQLGPQIVNQTDQYNNAYSKKGEFLKADTLVLLEYRLSPRSDSRKIYRILAVDESVFGVEYMRDLKDINKVAVLRAMLRDEATYLRSKSVFSNLNLDTGEANGFVFPASLRRYFTAFRRDDKESAKMIQAGSYAYSFYQFLTKETGFLRLTDEITFNVVGYSDKGISTMTVSSTDLQALEICYQIYKHQPRQAEVAQSKRDVLNTIKHNTALSFQDGRKFVEALMSIKTQAEMVLAGRSLPPIDTEANNRAFLSPRGSLILQRYHREEISGFHSWVTELSSDDIRKYNLELSEDRSALDLRDGHAQLVHRALADTGLTYVFLTGNPGIGKTHALASFLTPLVGEGFIFLYVSPRKQVNLDIIDKFCEEGKLADNNMIALNTNSYLIRDNKGRSTVRYQSNRYQGTLKKRGVTFIDKDNPESFEENSPVGGSLKSQVKTFKRASDETINVAGGGTSGVLKSLFEAIYTVIDQDMARNIIASASIQALKQTSHNKSEANVDTLRHFTTIFKNAYNERDGEVNPAKMKELARRFKHIFIMIDEVTGDESGVAFLQRISELLEEYQLIGGQHGFNTKVIVADASLVGEQVIRQHLNASRAVEPDKIFFTSAEEATAQPLSIVPYTYRKESDAVVINTNSYPASHLTLHYNIFVGCPSMLPPIQPGGPVPTSALSLEEDGIRLERPMLSFEEADGNIRRQYELIDEMQQHLASEIIRFVRQSEGQLIVYIQNKRRLFDLIERVNQELRRLRADPQADSEAEVFVRGEDYLEIHADIAQEEQELIQQKRNLVRVIFMTASASRGLSFPFARHIIVDVPGFDIEKNLMEIIQVVYRGRGDKKLDNSPKEISFYLSETINFDGEIPSQVRRRLTDGILNLFNILLILKASLMTRIQGYGQIGRDKFTIIPIGGKSLSAASDNFGDAMGDLLNLLKKEHNRKRQDTTVAFVYDSLLNLFSGSTTIIREINSLPGQPNRLLSNEILEKLSTDGFYKLIAQGLQPLLDSLAIEPLYVSGSLLIAPLENNQVHESYEFRLAQEIQLHANGQLRRKMEQIIRQPKIYTESLRSALRRAIELVEKIDRERVERTQFVEQTSRSSDRYYAVPQFILLSGTELKDYLNELRDQLNNTTEEELENNSFRDILARYIRALYPAENILPVTPNYGDFPYILFRCYNLREARRRIYTLGHALTSNELNVLGLILSKSEDE